MKLIQKGSPKDVLGIGGGDRKIYSSDKNDNGFYDSVDGFIQGNADTALDLVKKFNNSYQDELYRRGELRDLSLSKGLNRILQDRDNYILDRENNKNFNSGRTMGQLTDLPLLAATGVVGKGLSSVGKLDEIGAVVLKDGEPQLFSHASPNAFEQFSTKALGENTAAPSAREAHFGAGNVDTAKAYLSRDYELPANRTFEGMSPMLRESEAHKYLMRNDPEYSNMIAYKNTVRPGSKEYADARDMVWRKQEELLNIWDKDEAFKKSFNSNKRKKFQEALVNAEDVGTRDNIRQFYVDAENLAEYDMGGNPYREKTYYDLIKKAKEEGKDALVIRNTEDGGPMDDIIAFWGDPNRQVIPRFNNEDLLRKALRRK